MVTIIGIDPGLAETGIGIVRGTGRNIVSYAYGNIRTPAGMPLPQRLANIYERVREFIESEQPALVVVEDVFSLNRYPKSGITLGQVSGVVFLAGAKSGVPIIEVPVREAKQVLTGNGNASKMQLEMAVRHILQRDAPIKPWHASDALGMALIGLYRQAMPSRRRTVGADPEKNRSGHPDRGNRKPS